MDTPKWIKMFMIIWDWAVMWDLLKNLFVFHNTERAPQLQIGRKSLSLVETVGPYQIDT